MNTQSMYFVYNLDAFGRLGGRRAQHLSAMGDRDNTSTTSSSADQGLGAGVPVAPSDRVRRRGLALAGIAAFAAGSAFVVSRDGLLISQDTVFLWVLAALLALSLTDLGRWRRGVFVDWLPLGALLVFYDSSHGVAQLLGMRPHQALQVGFDRALFGKTLVAVQLQHLLHQGAGIQVWEYPLFVVYMSHFFTALVIAGVLWRFAYGRFRQFRARLVVLFGLGFLTYVLYPASPPWMVAKAHGITLHRVVVMVWTHTGLTTASSLVEQGSAFYNQVAAIPSMHAAVSMFILLFFWKGARVWVRAVLVSYVLAMAFILVYGGEHFVFDIVTGWLYAIAVTAGFALATRAQRAGALGTRWGLMQPAPIVGTPKPVAGSQLLIGSTCDDPISS
jgi:membrane-associated phospholipid phosphatase